MLFFYKIKILLYYLYILRPVFFLCKSYKEVFSYFHEYFKDKKKGNYPKTQIYFM